MASEEHKRLAAVIKKCHKSLREKSKLYGAEQAWVLHLQDEPQLQEYAYTMHRLAEIWETNSGMASLARSRVQWVAGFCTEYFLTDRIYLRNRERENRLLRAWAAEFEGPIQCKYFETPPDIVRLLDVGSCFNPFVSHANFETTALDLCPATPDVLRGDFLQIPIGTADQTTTECLDGDVLSLPPGAFDCVLFSLLLEYLPSSQQRLECCRKAYTLLRHEGLLIIITPDSQHVGKNAALMKNWRYTLATIGFMRVRIEKLPHISCLAFRKAIAPRIAQQWAARHKEEYMTEMIEIPQDNNNS